MDILKQFKSIKTFFFDMDGVLTDGTLLVKDDEWLRKMHIRDGHALQLAARKKYRIVIISGSKSEPVKLRLHKLGVKDVYMEVKDKKATLQKYLHDHKLNADETLYMGDDIPDLTSMQHVGFPTCPADAASELILVAKYISHFKGGEGCVRDVIEKVLKLNGDWDIE